MHTEESGKRGVERPEFITALSVVEAGDTLVFWKSDRWGRSAAHVLTTINELHDRGVTVKSLTENFDLDTKEGPFMFAVLAAAEYELELRAERQAEGNRGRQEPPGRRPDAARQETHRPPESDRAGRDRHASPPRRRRRLRHPSRPHPENLPLHRLRLARQHTLPINTRRLASPRPCYRRSGISDQNFPRTTGTPRATTADGPKSSTTTCSCSPAPSRTRAPRSRRSRRS